MVLGSPGGSTIISSVLAVIVNVIDYDQPPAEAVDLPRFHHQWPPIEPEADLIIVETDERYDLEPGSLKPLQGLGYSLGEIRSLRDVQAVFIDGRQVIGVFDRRRTGGVVYD